MVATLLLLLAALAQPAAPTASQAATPEQAAADGWHTLALAGGGELAYKLGLPDDFDPDRTYPALLALPPGAQTREMVEASWTRYWGAQAGARGWIVVSPAAPAGASFLDGAEDALPELLRHVHERFRVEHGRVHLAGASNGGRSAFRAATRWPREFLSLTVLPGHPPTDEDAARLERLAGWPVTLYVGGDDGRWVERTEAAAQALRAAGARVTTTVFPGEGHVPPSLDGDVVMERLEQVRRGLDAVTTVLVVRHADRRGHEDALSEAGHARAEALARHLADARLDAVYATQYERTLETVAPTARAHGLEPRRLPAAGDFAAHVLREHPGETVLVAGHSNTVPAIVRALGVDPGPELPAELSEDRYGDLFVVSVRGGDARLLRLRF